MPGFQASSQRALPVYQVDDDGLALGGAANPVQQVANLPALPAGTARNGTANIAAASLAAANTARKGLIVQNVSTTATIYISEFGTAVAGAAGTNTIGPGATYRASTNRAQSIASSADGAAYTGVEF